MTIISINNNSMIILITRILPIQICATDLMLADLLTKPLQGPQKFLSLRDKLLGPRSPDELRSALVELTILTSSSKQYFVLRTCD